VADLVEANGYTVLTAKTGLEALTQLDAVPPPTLCVMDLFMPGLGGTELLQRMRDNPLWKGIPVIAVSGARRDKALVDELERLGVQDFVDKQVVSIDSLGALVEEYLGPARRRSPHKRVSTFALAEFRRIPTEPWLTGLVCNLSLGGAFLRTLLPPKADQLIQVRIDLGPTRITTACRVAWSRSLLTGHSEPFGMGVDFADLGADALKTLGDWVASASTLPGV
jgi:CheY-like chemotaxis protein